MSQEGKARMDLLPLAALERVAREFERGNKRPGRVSWDWKQKVEEQPELFAAALLRHLTRWQRKDRAGRIEHMAAVAANALMLLDMEVGGEPEEDM
jgi:hypothetical protein